MPRPTGVRREHTPHLELSGVLEKQTKKATKKSNKAKGDYGGETKTRSYGGDPLGVLAFPQGVNSQGYERPREQGPIEGVDRRKFRCTVPTGDGGNGIAACPG